MGQKDFKFEISDLREELSGGDRKIASMLGALKRVEAPADFDLHLKGRIARGVPSSGPMIAPWLRFAALPVLLLGLAGFLAFNGTFTFGGEDVPPVVESRFQPDEAPIPAPTIERVAITEADRERDASPVPVNAVSRATVPERKDRVITPLRPSGGSVDRTLKETNTRRFPRGITIDPPVVSQRSGELQDGAISVKDILSSVGVAAERSAGGWTVKNIRAKSQAENSGVQASDIVEAIGSHSVKDKESLNGNVTADSITLVRSGKRIVVKLAGL